ncbi:HEPN domain-containing protein [Apilactobacillus ozensis]|uniref:HEPN domain-containing protein n=1 Tax=Apilactobacillus ozensis TaxID=866801 RepID=UPI0006D089CD|nr:HEPN domain-containing protein [Apilactobacillus ozensis]
MHADSGFYFSEKEDLSKSIINIFSNGLTSNKNDDLIFKDIMNLINSEPKVFFCIIPIHGVILGKNYNFGFVNFYPAEMKNKIIKANYNKNITKFLTSKSSKVGDFDGENFVTISVKSLSSQRASEIAVSEVYKALNVIKFLFNYNLDDLYQLGVGKKSSSIFDKEFIVGSNELNKALKSHPFKFLPFSVNFNKLNDNGNEYLNKMFSIQSKIYNNEKTLPLERSLLNVVNLVASGLYTDDYNTSMVKFMSAIEALVEQKTFNQSITEQVCERTALLIGKTFDKRKEIYTKMTKLYNKRSIISHGGTIRVTKWDVDYLFKISQCLFFYFLDKFDFFNDSNKKEKHTLKDYIIKLKLK